MSSRDLESRRQLTLPPSQAQQSHHDPHPRSRRGHPPDPDRGATRRAEGTPSDLRPSTRSRFLLAAPHPLLHRLPRSRNKAPLPLPKPLHRNHRRHHLLVEPQHGQRRSQPRNDFLSPTSRTLLHPIRPPYRPRNRRPLYGPFGPPLRKRPRNEEQPEDAFLAFGNDTLDGGIRGQRA